MYFDDVYSKNMHEYLKTEKVWVETFTRDGEYSWYHYEYLAPDRVSITFEPASDEDVNQIRSVLQEKLGYGDNVTVGCSKNINEYSDGSYWVYIDFQDSFDENFNYSVSKKLFSLVKEKYNITKAEFQYNRRGFFNICRYWNVPICTSNYDKPTAQEKADINAKLSELGIAAQLDPETGIVQFTEETTELDRVRYVQFIKTQTRFYIGNYCNTIASAIPRCTIDLLADETIYCYGDANGDNDMSIADSVLVMQSLAAPDRYPMTEQGRINADIENPGDGITNLDALAIQNKLLGIK